jgi:hypothetical protein
MTELVVQQSSATAAYRRVYLHLVDATDGITPETGIAAATAMLSVNGAAAAASTNNIVEIDAGDLPGAYYLELTAAELGTLGTIRGGFKAAACAWAPFTVKVVAYDPHAAGPTAADIRTELDANSTKLANLDATISSRASAAALATVDDFVDTEVAALVTAVAALPTAAQNADALLARNVAGGGTGTRPVSEALATLRNRVAISGTTLTVYAADDTTPLYTATITRTAGDPLSAIDPA